MTTELHQSLKRRGTAASWTSANPVLLAGEEGFETDTRKSKVGDGTTAWNGLSYTAATTSDATTSSKGSVQLAGDLGGTAASPTVPGLAGKASTATSITAGTGLNGGGDLSASRTLAVSYGTTSGTAAQGNDSRIVGALSAATAATTYAANAGATVSGAWDFTGALVTGIGTGGAASIAMSGTGIDLTGVSDSTTAIQALLTANPGKVIEAIAGATYKFSSALVMRTGQTLRASGATLTWVGATGDGITNYAAITPIRTAVTDAAITAASATLTSATVAFTIADVGRTVTITGAGPLQQKLSALIAGVTNGTTAVLDSPAKYTVTGATLAIYQRDVDISVIGGNFVRDGTSTQNHFMVFRRVDRIKIKPDTVTTTGGLYAINFGDATDVLCSGVVFPSTVRDAIHVNGPARRVLISDISAKSGDDVVSVTGTDYSTFAYWDECVGDVYDITIRNIQKQTGGAAACVRVLGGADSKVRGVRIDHISGVSATALVYVMDWPGGAGTIGNDCDGVMIGDVSGSTTSANGLIELGGLGLRSVAISNVVYTGGSATGSSAILVSSRATGSTLDLCVSNVVSSLATNTFTPIVFQGTWASAQIANLRHTGSATTAGSGAAVQIDSASGPVTLQGAQVRSSTALITVGATGTVPLNLSNIVLDSPANGIAVTSNAAITGTISGITGATVGGLISLTGSTASADLHIEGNHLTSGGVLTRSAAQRVRLAGESALVDVTALSPATGDVVSNTNTALACGIGPAVFKAGGNPDGWKGLYSGTIYAPPPFVTDTFTGTNGTAITAHTPDTGSAWAYRTGAGSISLNGSGAGVLATNNGSYSMWYSPSTAPLSDYAVRLDVTPASATDTEVGPCVRASSTATTFVVAHMGVSASVSRFSVVQVLSGGFSVLGQTSGVTGGSFSTSETYRITISTEGTTVKASLQRLSDSNWLTTAGTWQVATTIAVTGTTTVTAVGYPGIVTAMAVSNGTVIDNFSATS